MKTVKIKNFKTKQQNRVALLQVLVNHTNWGLRIAKENMDLMMEEDKPIIFEVDESKQENLVNELINLGLEFEIE